VAISFVCMLQLAFAVGIEARYDRPALLVFLLGPLYPLGYWVISAAAAIRDQLPAFVSGPVSSGSSGTFRANRSSRRAATATATATAAGTLIARQL
jgi:hypothetical protein